MNIRQNTTLSGEPSLGKSYLKRLFEAFQNSYPQLEYYIMKIIIGFEAKSFSLNAN